MRTLYFALLLTALTISSHAQKVKIGFDKTADFSRYKTFSWAKYEEGGPELTLRKMAVMGEIEKALEAKGVTRVDEGGDLILAGFGGLGGQQAGYTYSAILPSFDSMLYPTATSWTGAPMGAGSTVLKGMLVLDMADASTKKLVWEGMVSVKLDMDNKPKSIERIQAAIAKLMAEYPPKTK